MESSKLLSMKQSFISVIIPTYNEGKTIVKTIRSVIGQTKIKHSGQNSFEIIVSDASDNSQTLTALKKSGLKKVLKNRLTIIKSAKGRAVQMNVGAKKARGKILLFLHSDTLLPRHWDALVNSIDADYGCFYKRFDDNSLFFRVNALYTNLRSRLIGYIVGDHALFVKRSVFRAVRGYARLKIMEDVDLSLRLRKAGYKRAVITQPVITSARRFKKKGVFKTWVLMQKIKWLYFFGVGDKKLVEMYR